VTQHIRRELMVPPERRTENNVSVLEAATAHLEFFQNLAREPDFRKKDVHPKICRRLVAVDHVRGEAVVRRSNRW
jgi:hypothetical protein